MRKFNKQHLIVLDDPTIKPMLNRIYHVLEEDLGTPMTYEEIVVYIITMVYDEIQSKTIVSLAEFQKPIC